MIAHAPELASAVEGVELHSKGTSGFLRARALTTGTRGAGMDVMVQPAVERPPWVRDAWDLTDLLGRPLGCIMEVAGGRFFIDPNKRGHILMPHANLGPHASLNEALTEIEKHTHGVCHRAPEEN